MMQDIAAEMGMSETVFIHDGIPAEYGYIARIFTPTQELAFAGHPSLGAATVYDLKSGRSDKSIERQYEQDTSAKSVNMTVIDQSGSVRVRMDQGLAEFGPNLNLEESDQVLDGVGDAAAKYAVANGIRVVSMGLPSLMYPLADSASLEALDPKMVSVEVLSDLGAKTMYAFTKVGPHEYLARCFAGPVGVPEDPATGSAAGSLGAHLQKMSNDAPKIEIQIQQGQWLNRESSIKVYAESNEDGTHVAIEGSCVVIGQGEFTL